MKPIDFLRAAYPARREIIPCLVGEPGIGKTQCVYELGEELGVSVHMMNMNGKTPSEVIGMAMPNNEKGTMDIYNYGILCDAKDGDIIIVDEMFTAAPACMNAILTWAESRILPSGDRMADVFIVAAANPLPSPDRMSLAARDRFQIIQVGWNRKTWCDWIKRKYGIEVEDALADKVRTKGTEYNVPTPRTMTKYIWWLSQICTTKEERLKVYEVIEEVFDKDMANKFRHQFESRTKNKQMLDAIADCGVKIEDTFVTYNNQSVFNSSGKAIEDMDAVELIDLLMKLENWDKLAGDLSNIELEEE